MKGKEVSYLSTLFRVKKMKIKFKDKTIAVQGGKNSSLGLIPLFGLCTSLKNIENEPDITDVNILIQIMQDCGFPVYRNSSTVSIGDFASCDIIDNISPNLSNSIRSSLYLLPIVAFHAGTCTMSFPGGCDLGDRGIDLHISVLKRIGYDVETTHDKIIVSYTGANKSFEYTFPYQSHMASIVALYGSIICDNARIRNLGAQPEVQYFAEAIGVELVQKAGSIDALIENKIHGPIDTVSALPDRIACFSWICFILSIYDEVEIIGITKYIHADLVESQVFEIEYLLTGIRIKLKDCPQAINIETGVYPKLTTDNFQALACFMIIRNIPFNITDTMFENRMKFAEELMKVGYNLTISDTEISTISGKNSKVLKYDGAKPHIINAVELDCSDLRGNFALAMIYYFLEKKVTVKNIDVINRGYVDFTCAKKIYS